MQVWIEGRELSPSKYEVNGDVIRIRAGYRNPENLRELLDRQESSIMHVEQEIRDNEDKVAILRRHLEEMKRNRDDIANALAEEL